MKPPVRAICIGVLCVAMAGTGCLSKRSISNTDFRYGGYWGGPDAYRGELSEFSLLGIDPGRSVTEAEIAQAFQNGSKLNLKRGSAILLMQSGAQFPDEPMQRLLGEHFKVGPFSGVPAGKPDDPQPPNLASALRLAAAQGGYDYILCYWGILEAQQRDLAGKTVSWVPLVGRVVPDETQEMRMQLKLIVLDARTGQWTMLVPEPVSTDAMSAKLTRENVDQAQIEKLKEEGYAKLVEELVERHVHD
jgi:hypothetical protein